MDRDAFLEAMILELQRQQNLSINLFEDANKIQLNPMDVYRKLCFDYPEVTYESLDCLCDGIVKAIDGSFSWNQSYYLNDKFLENIVQLATSAPSETNSKLIASASRLCFIVFVRLFRSLFFIKIGEVERLLTFNPYYGGDIEPCELSTSKCLDILSKLQIEMSKFSEFCVFSLSIELFVMEKEWNYVLEFISLLADLVFGSQRYEFDPTSFAAFLRDPESDDPLVLDMISSHLSSLFIHVFHIFRELLCHRLMWFTSPRLEGLFSTLPNSLDVETSTSDVSSSPLSPIESFYLLSISQIASRLETSYQEYSNTSLPSSIINALHAFSEFLQKHHHLDRMALLYKKELSFHWKIAALDPHFLTNSEFSNTKLLAMEESMTVLAIVRLWIISSCPTEWNKPLSKVNSYLDDKNGKIILDQLCHSGVLPFLLHHSQGVLLWLVETLKSSNSINNRYWINGQRFVSR